MKRICKKTLKLEWHCLKSDEEEYGKIPATKRMQSARFTRCASETAAHARRYEYVQVFEVTK